MSADVISFPKRGEPGFIPAIVPGVTHWRGHRLPLRLEWNFEGGQIWFELVDNDHRRVLPEIRDFDQLRGLMEIANATGTRHYPRRGLTLAGDQIAYPTRLVEGHPVAQARWALAFECLCVGAHTGWIDETVMGHLSGVGACEPTGPLIKKQVLRWHDWRLAENAALRRHKLS